MIRRGPYPLLSGILLCAAAAMAEVRIPTIETLAYRMEGDVNLGIVLPIHYCLSCGKLQLNMFQASEAIMEAVRQINANSRLLPNISLGVTLLDDHLDSTYSLARVLQLLPEKFIESGRKRNPMEDIVGLFGGITSDGCLVMVRFLELFDIPLLSARCSNDDLSRFPNFLRLVPPDKYQVKLMMDILLYYNWSYVSFVYVDNTYGRNALQQMELLSKEYGICIAVTKGVPFKPTDDDIRGVVRTLRKHRNARVIVSFLYSALVKSLLQGWNDYGSEEHHFIWIFSDSLQVGMAPALSNAVLGSFFLSFDINQPENFDEKFSGLSSRDLTANPWWRDYWQQLFNCSWQSRVDNCEQYLHRNISSSPKYLPYQVNALFLDGIYVFANALHKIIARDCPEATVYKDGLSTCINTTTLTNTLYDTAFNGSMGYVKFDNLGDFMGGYKILQMQKNKSEFERVLVGGWERITKDSSQLDMLPNMVDFDSFTYTMCDGLDRPPSVCSLPCKAGEIKVILEQRCCWECRRCDENKYLVDNNTRCKKCPEFQWPDQETFQTCTDISPTYLQWNEPMGLVLVALSLCGIAATLFTVGVFVVHRTKRAIRASGRELSMIILVGTLLSYLTVFSIIARPTLISCYFQRIAFHLSYTLVYASLLTKTNWIYRLFTVVKKGQKKPKLAGAKIQIIFTLMQVIPQLVISISTSVLMPPEVTLQMHVPTVRYVELLCSLPAEALVTSISYNLILVLISAFYGYKTRKLPNNFNESRYIFFSVSATIFLWIAFIPTFFAAFYTIHKSILLALSLLLSSTMILLCIFFTRIYALFYVEEERMNFSMNSVRHDRLGSGRDTSFALANTDVQEEQTPL